MAHLCQKVEPGAVETANLLTHLPVREHRPLLSSLPVSLQNSGILRFSQAWQLACTHLRDMDALTTAAASGLQSRMDALDMLANNLANSSTSGYKADREFYGSYLAPELAGEANPIVGESPVVQRPWTDFGQSTLVNTGSSTDLALSGAGFFAANGPNGPLYTRNGNFHLSAQGVLVTAEGYPVRLAGTPPQTLQVQSTSPIQVGSDGQIFQDGAPLGQLELTDFKDPSKLTKTSAAYFQNPTQDVNGSTMPDAAGATAATDAQVNQGKLESSNAAPTEAAARMITILRHFEMLQHAIKLGAEMNQHAVQEVARVGS